MTISAIINGTYNFHGHVADLLPIKKNDNWPKNPETIEIHEIKQSHKTETHNIQATPSTPQNNMTDNAFNLMQAVNSEIPEIKIGPDTVGTSRKTATYDLRTVPPPPKFTVSPWNTTIEQYDSTKPLC